jgi:hypothetical protein
MTHRLHACRKALCDDAAVWQSTLFSGAFLPWINVDSILSPQEGGRSSATSGQGSLAMVQGTAGSPFP